MPNSIEYQITLDRGSKTKLDLSRDRFGPPSVPSNGKLSGSDTAENGQKLQFPSIPVYLGTVLLIDSMKLLRSLCREFREDFGSGRKLRMTTSM